MRKHIEIPGHIKYLTQDDFMIDLPSNSIFDKGKVGCGGTTVALNSDKPYVIVVPYDAMIENKSNQSRPENSENYDYKLKYNIIAIDGSKYISKKWFNEELKKSPVAKIMVTYNSLYKLSNFINPTYYNLLIDEYHILFTKYAFRNKAIKSVLSEYNKYKEVCFMSATILEDEYVLQELKGLDIYEAKWNNVKDVKIESVQCKFGVNDTVVKLILEHLIGDRKGNAYFFVNSVEYIKKLVKECRLDNSTARAIWSKYNIKETGLKRSTTLDAPKKINFLTSCTFEGGDIYDEDAIIYIVSDGSKATTLIDISTSFQQIAGRVRNTKYIDKIYHIYSNTRYNNHLSLEDFTKYSNERSVDAEDTCKEFNELSERARQTIPNNTLNEYIAKNEDSLKFEVDKNLKNLDIYNFKVCKHLYSCRVNINDAYTENGFKNINAIENNNHQVIKMDLCKNFKLTIQEIEKKPTDMELINAAYIRYPWLKEVIGKIGLEEIKKCNYHIGNVRQKAIVKSDAGNEIKIYKLLNLKLKIDTGAFYNLLETKYAFAEVYKELGIDRKAKASDIEKYYDTNRKAINNNGCTENGYVILKSKFQYETK